MIIETERLIIKEFALSMAKAVHENLLNDDNRRFVPDEVFETEDDARETIEYLMSQKRRTLFNLTGCCSVGLNLYNKTER